MRRALSAWVAMGVVMGIVLASQWGPFSALGYHSPPTSPPEDAPVGFAAYSQRYAWASESRSQGDGWVWIWVQAEDNSSASAGATAAVPPNSLSAQNDRVVRYWAYVAVCDQQCSWWSWFDEIPPTSFTTDPVTGTSRLHVLLADCEIDVTWSSDDLPAVDADASIDPNRANGSVDARTSTRTRAVGDVCVVGTDTDSAGHGTRVIGAG